MIEYTGYRNKTPTENCNVYLIYEIYITKSLPKTLPIKLHQSIKFHCREPHVTWQYLSYYFFYLRETIVKFQYSFSSPEQNAQVSVNFSHFRLLLKNAWPDFNETWHESSLGNWDLKVLKWGTQLARRPGAAPIPTRDPNICYFQLLLINTWVVFNQTG